LKTNTYKESLSDSHGNQNNEEINRIKDSYTATKESLRIMSEKLKLAEQSSNVFESNNNLLKAKYEEAVEKNETLAREIKKLRNNFDSTTVQS